MFLPPLSSTASRFMCQTIPLHQPQPIRPIPIIPLSDISSSFSEDLSMSSHRSSPYLPQAHGGSAHTDAHLPEIGPEASDSHNTIDFLSPFSLLCQPVSDVVRYQLKPAIDARRHRNNTSSTSASGGLDEHYYNNGLPKILGGLFCACGCLGLKHLQSDAGGSHL
jgi:hypothetical protein